MDVPAYLASLINNDRPDVLATAYAPPAPDYASTSPFASLSARRGGTAGGTLHSADRRARPCLDVAAAAADRVHRGRAEMPRRGHLFRGARRNRQRPGRRRPGDSQPRPQSRLSRHDLRRRLSEPPGATAASSPSPATARAARAQRAPLPRRRGGRHGGDGGQDILPEIGSSTHYHATYVSPRWARSWSACSASASTSSTAPGAAAGAETACRPVGNPESPPLAAVLGGRIVAA
jgi:hypothetical protein